MPWGFMRWVLKGVVNIFMSVSFWLKKDHLLIDCDITIVGAGLTGASIAYWLKKKDPHLSVALIEKHHLASGASGRNAGFLTCGSIEHFHRLVEFHGEEKATQIWKFSETNMELLKSEIIKTNPEEVDFLQKGSFSLAISSSEQKELVETAHWMKKKNIQVEEVTRQQIEERLGVQGFWGGIKYLGDGEIHPSKLVKKIFHLSKATIYENCEVYELEKVNDRHHVKTNQGLFRTSAVILATNGYSSLLHPYFEKKIIPTRGQVLILEPTTKFMEAPCYARFYLDYFRQLPSGHLLVGGFRIEDDDKGAGFSDHITSKVQSALELFVKTHFPTLTHKKILHRWSGLMGFSPDSLPLLGATSDQHYFLGGYTGHGFGMAFHCAKKMVDLLYGESIPDFLSAKRFTESHPSSSG